MSHFRPNLNSGLRTICILLPLGCLLGNRRTYGPEAPTIDQSYLDVGPRGYNPGPKNDGPEAPTIDLSCGGPPRL
eukprot:843985-Karenia_brevis.AAC.1